MATYKLEQFMFKPWDQWPVEENELFTVVLRSGESFQMDTARMEISSTFWDLYKQFRKLEANPEHFLRSSLISNRDIENMNNAFIRSIYDVYRPEEFCKEELWLTLDRISTNIYNMTLEQYSEYIRGYGSIEYGELYFHPTMVEIREAIQPNPKSIIDGQKKATKFLLNEESIRHHPIIIDLRTNAVKMEQFLQTILVRGFNTDLDSHIYRKPIMANYFNGIIDPAEAMMESTLAAKALFFQDGPLKQTEYANRRLQLSASHVDLLIEGDCGVKSHDEITITKGRLSGMLGLYYEIGNELKPIREGDTHLIGKKLKLRMPHSCGYRHMQSICSTCFGELSHSIPYGTNLGVTGSGNTISVVSQGVLKVKHSENSTDIESIVLTTAEQDFIALSDCGENIHATQTVKEKGGVLILNARARGKDSNASMLPIILVSDVKGNADTSKITQFEKVTFGVPRNDGTGRSDLYHVTVSRGTRKSFLTAEFIRFIIKNDLRVSDDGKYYIPLDDWNVDKPIFELPRQHLNMRDFATEVVTFIQSSKGDSSSRHLGNLPQLSHYDYPADALVDLYDLVTSKISVHMAHLSTVILSMMVARDDDRNFHTPDANTPIKFARYEDIMSKRSLGGLFAYQKGANHVNKKLEQYINQNRPPHFLDGAVLP